MQYNAAIIGLGQIGFKIDLDPLRKIIWSHAKAYVSIKNINLVAVSEKEKKNITLFKNNYPNIKVYKDYQNLLQKCEIDIISICTPTKTHLGIVKKIIKHKRLKVVFCEKPVGRNYSDCQEIINLCSENKIVLVSNYMRRWDDRFQSVKKLIDKKELGELKSISAYGNTALLTSTSHLIDMFIFYGGTEIDWLIGELQQDYVRIIHGNKDPGGKAFVKFTNGVYGHINGTSSNSYNYMFEIDILFTFGRIIIADDCREITVWKFSDKETSTGTGYRTLEKCDKNRFYPENERMLCAIENLINCIEKRNNPKSNGSNALEVHKLINAIKLSSDGSKKIKYSDIYA